MTKRFKQEIEFEIYKSQHKKIEQNIFTLVPTEVKNIIILYSLISR